ncbi:MAG: 6-pyruvoyl-tetrahydropterin synthase-related protein [candidate division WOR-3 bacterium]
MKPKKKPPQPKPKKLSEKKKIYLVLFAIAFIASLSFVARGYPTAGDVWPHLARVKMVQEWLKTGSFPFFSFFFYSGYPALRFYSPLFFLLAGVLSLIFGIFWATKISLFLTNILSGFAFFLFLKEIKKDIKFALFGSLVYLLVPWRIMYVGGVATYPLNLTFLFLPLAFLALEKIFQNPSFKNSLLLSLTISCLILSHFVYALWSFLFLLLYFLFRRQFAKKVFLYGFLGLIFSFLQSSFFLLPFLIKFPSHSFPQPYQKLPSPNPIVLFGLRSEIGGYTGAYLGWSLIFLLIFAFLYQKKKKILLKDGVFFSLLLSLFLTFFPTFLKKGDPILTAGLPPQRFLAFFVFFSGIAVLDGIKFFQERLFKLGMDYHLTFLLLFLILIFDCLPRSFYPLYSKREELLGLREEIYEILKRENVVKLVDIDIPTEGIDIFKRTCRYPALGYIFADLPTVYGPPYHQFASKNMLYIYPWMNRLAVDLGDSTTQTLSENSLKIMRLAGISNIISLPTLIGGTVDQTFLLLKKGIWWDDRFILAERKPPLAIGKYPYLSLFLASNRIKPLPLEKIIPEKSFCIAEDWQDLLEKISIDHEKGNCSFIPLRFGQREDSLLGEEPTINLHHLNLDHNLISAEISASKDCFLRAAVSFYPEIKVLVDERELEIFETKDHFLAFPFPAGKHQIKIFTEKTPIDIYPFYLSLLTLLFSFLFIIIRRKDG